jgi:hypothetical protein
MPMDSPTQSPPSEDWGLNRASGWHLHFCLRPRKCFLTDRKLWFKLCYKGTRMITGPGEPVFVDYYIDKFEFIIWNLKRRT